MCSKLNLYKKANKFFRLNFGRGNEVAFLAFFDIRLVLFGDVHKAVSQLKIMPYVQSEKTLLPPRGMLGLLVLEKYLTHCQHLNSQNTADRGSEN